MSKLREIRMIKDAEGYECLLIDDLVVNSENLEELNYWIVSSDRIIELYNTDDGELFCDLIGDSYTNIGDKKIISENLVRIESYHKLDFNNSCNVSLFYIFDNNLDGGNYHENISRDDDYNKVRLHHLGEIIYQHFTKK